MATTKSTKTASRSKKSSSNRKQDQSLAARTGRTVRDRPYASAAIATGAATLAAGIAGLIFMKKSGKTFAEVKNDVASSVREGVGDAREKFDDVKAKVKDGVADVRGKIDNAMDRRRDGLDPDRDQNEIMEEALSLKETGAKPKKPVDPTIQKQNKAGAVAY